MWGGISARRFGRAGVDLFGMGFCRRVYLAGALDSSSSGAASAGVFGLLYGLLYLLVTSDDYALLAGALGLFAVLAVAMVLTRKVNWYQVT